MLRHILIALTTLLSTACTTNTASPPSVMASPIGTPTHTWVSLELAPQLDAVISSDTITQQVLKALEPHAQTVVGSGSPTSAEVPAGCSDVSCFTHLRETMSIHHVVSIIITSHQPAWEISVALHDLAYGKTRVRLNEHVRGDARAIQDKLGSMVESAYSSIAADH
ncbi:uncharacterized protein METZ01_LOCUS367257 [marine metagenome]|uniref:Uncharacterized protein n=1 Tax=marine metagenome TaxID=408172 RepID=A0A382SXE3_9ZZZZ